MTRSKATTSIEDIPTLHDLYSQGELENVKKEHEEFPGDAKLNKRVSIWRGDITTLSADIIVNAANKSLLGGGGVDGAIHSAAGPDLLEECEGLGGAQTGETKITKGYNLPAKYIAHTVGPIFSSSKKELCRDQLRSCYSTSLNLAKENGCKSVGFSSISTGIYGYPMQSATALALETTRDFLENDDSIERVIYVVFSKKDEDVYRHIAPYFFPHSESTEEPLEKGKEE